MSKSLRSAMATVLLCGSMAAPASAQTERPLKLRTDSSKATSIKPAPANPCAAFGAGFVRVEGSATCVKVGGAISAGVGVAR